MNRIVIIGAGIGGLSAAALLGARGFEVDVFESARVPGGKARRLSVAGVPIDAGPTVFTLRPAFEQLFAQCGAALSDHIDDRPVDILARHAWADGSRLDLHADPDRSAAAVEAFAGTAAAQGWRKFQAAAARVYAALEDTFLHAPSAGPLTLSARFGVGRLPQLLALRPYESLWRVLGEYFPDPRLRQLYARYSTYCGSSPFAAPSTLSLIAHVEAAGVWAINGGLSALAAALETVARGHGVRFHYGRRIDALLTEHGRASGVLTADGERVSAAAIIANADPAALAAGRLGPAAARAVAPIARDERSFSAVVWLARGQAQGWTPAMHNVAFSPDYPAEFADLAAGRPPADPTIYVCALDRGDPADPPGAPERFQLIMNAPADGDRRRYDAREIDRCTAAMRSTLARAGLPLQLDQAAVLTPSDFEVAFPSTGGALYGRASHGWAASFRRQGARTRIPGLYCAGGSTHPGAGVPMAALSARLAVRALMEDRASTSPFRRRATAGGMSTRSATAGAMASPSSASSAVSSAPTTNARAVTVRTTTPA